MKARQFLLGTAMLFSIISCSFNEQEFVPAQEENSQMPILLSGSITNGYETKVNGSGFCDGDVVGVYIVDYNGNQPGTLLNSGNRADNLRFTFDAETYKWTPAYDIYWKDKNTHIDLYGYYPWKDSGDVENFSFEVEKEQRTEASTGMLGGYEASDFLWGKTLDVAPTSSVIRLQFNHIMANVRVTLVEGSGFEKGEWANAQKQVMILNTARKSTINLKTGVVTASNEIPNTGTIPYKDGEDYRAIVVPQTIPANTELISISINGDSYFLKKSEDMVFVPSKQHNFTITVNKRAAQGGLEFNLSAESITVWEDDPQPHKTTPREYVIIDVQEPGTLDKCIADAGKDLTKIKHLKLTGKINSRDFGIMQNKMGMLSSLNLKEVTIVKCTEHREGDDFHYNENKDNQIPSGALSGNPNLISLILPDSITSIGAEAFAGCGNITGSLILPEGLVEIEVGAFRDCGNMTGELYLPTTLEYIGVGNQYDAYWSGAFCNCGFISELKLPDGLKYIGLGAFNGCRGLYGELHLPNSLEHLGDAAFNGCSSMTGSIEIPQNITVIGSATFAGGFNGTLTLHDGITSIGGGAFQGAPLKGELRLPANLQVISPLAFYGCDFSGNLVLPKGLRSIGSEAFSYNWRLMGTLEFPDDMISIGSRAFANCSGLEGLIFPEGLENILSSAFEDCFGIGRIVCKGEIPPYIQNGAFNGVAKDNFTLEVPETAVHLYQTTAGWRDFKRISAYRNLVIRPSMATAINTSVTRTLVLTADDEWYVESHPDWVSLNKTSGTGKTEILLTFHQMPRESEPREGEIVFMLKDKDYRTKCKLTQYDYEYAEDEYVTLYRSPRENAIDLVILGDGYNAKEISEGKLIENATEAYEHFFDIEPYKTYKDYFNVYTAISVSPESGIGSVNTIIYNKFNTTAKGGVTLGGRNDSDMDYIIDYVCKAPTVSKETLYKTVVIMLPNTYDYGGICYMWPEGFSISYCPMSTYGYPQDFRGIIQHEAGGHGFGKLGDEYIYHNTFIDACPCTCCGHTQEFYNAKWNGWFDNLSLSGKFSEVPWSHLIFHEKYSNIVDVFEGGFMHNRGVYRSEQNSCMNNNIPYYSTISRESIVRRIKHSVGEEYSFEDFVANDKIEVSTSTKSMFTDYQYLGSHINIRHNAPVIMDSLSR